MTGNELVLFAFEWLPRLFLLDLLLFHLLADHPLAIRCWIGRERSATPAELV